MEVTAAITWPLLQQLGGFCSPRGSGKNLDESLTRSNEETPFPNRLCTQQVTLKAPGSLAEPLLISKKKKKKRRETTLGAA